MKLNQQEDKTEYTPGYLEYSLMINPPEETKNLQKDLRHMTREAPEHEHQYTVAVEWQADGGDNRKGTHVFPYYRVRKLKCSGCESEISR